MYQGVRSNEHGRRGRSPQPWAGNHQAQPEKSPLELFAEGWMLCCAGTAAFLEMMVASIHRLVTGARVSGSTKLLVGCLALSCGLAMGLVFWSIRNVDGASKHSFSYDGASVESFDAGAGRDIHRHSHQEDDPRRNRQWDGGDTGGEQKRDSGAHLMADQAGPFLAHLRQGRLPAALRDTKAARSHASGGCPLHENEDSILLSKKLSPRLPARPMHQELSEKLEQHTALQHMMCRRQAGFQAVRALIYACPQHNCLGFTGGLRGLLVAYLLAAMTGRAFFVRDNSWMDFHGHLQVSASWRSVDWQVKSCSWAQMDGEKRLSDALDRTRPLNYMAYRDARCERILNFYSLRPNIVAVITDHDVNCVYKILAKGNLELLRPVHESPLGLAFGNLFTFSDDVLSGEYRLQEELGWSPERSICIHVRTGAFSSQDQAGNGHRNVGDFWRCARMLEHAVGLDNASDVTWLVLSDDEQTQRGAEKFLAAECKGQARRPVLSSSLVLGEDAATPPQHDRQASPAGVKRMLMDMRLLSQCQHVVLSKSLFGTMAASIPGGKLTLSDKHHVLVTEQEIAHDKPLSQLCQRVIPDWDTFQYP